MSPRNFARVFRREAGTTPAKFVEAARVEEARRRLEETPLTTAAIATGCGFGTTESMRRAFLRHLGIGPAEYRRRFQPSSLEPPTALAAHDDPRRVALVRRRSALSDAELAN